MSCGLRELLRKLFPWRPELAGGMYVVLEFWSRAHLLLLFSRSEDVRLISFLCDAYCLGTKMFCSFLKSGVPRPVTYGEQKSANVENKEIEEIPVWWDEQDPT